MIYVYDKVAGEVVPREELTRRESLRQPSKRRAAIKVKTVQRGRWVFVGGEMIPAHEYYGRPDRANAPQIMSDIEPYRSMHDGSRIGGRRQHREHLRQHGLIEYGNELPKPMGGVPMPRAGQDVKDAIDMVRAGHRPGPVGTFNAGEFE